MKKSIYEIEIHNDKMFIENFKCQVKHLTNRVYNDDEFGGKIIKNHFMLYKTPYLLLDVPMAFGKIENQKIKFLII